MANVLTGVLRITTLQENFLYDPRQKKIARFYTAEQCDQAIKKGKSGKEVFDDETIYKVLNLQIGEPFVYKVQHRIQSGKALKTDIVVSYDNVKSIKSCSL